MLFVATHRQIRDRLQEVRVVDQKFPPPVIVYTEHPPQPAIRFYRHTQTAHHTLAAQVGWIRKASLSRCVFDDDKKFAGQSVTE